MLVPHDEPFRMLVYAALAWLWVVTYRYLMDNQDDGW